jgi:hypothetical protein
MPRSTGGERLGGVGVFGREQRRKMRGGEGGSRSGGEGTGHARGAPRGGLRACYHKICSVNERRPRGECANFSQKGDLDLTEGSLDLTEGSLDLTICDLDRTIGDLDLTEGSLDLTICDLDRTIGDLDWTKGIRFIGRGKEEA